MTTLPQIWSNILIFFGFKKEVTPGQSLGAEFALNYGEKLGINLTYIAANKIANYVTTDSTIAVSGKDGEATKRSELLDICAKRLWRDKKMLVSRAAGVGKMCVFPYVSDGAIKSSYVSQDRIIVFGSDGERATDIAILSETATQNRTIYGKYKRYSLKNSVHTIATFYTDESRGKVLGEVPPIPQWTKTPPVIIAGVEQLLFAAIDCPVDPRNGDNFYRVSITDGCADIIKDIQGQFQYLAKEYDLKRVFIGADEALFQGKGNLPDKQIFKIMDTGIDEFFKIFDPAIRAEPIYLRLKNTFELLEKHIGLSQGIYTNAENVGAYNNQSNIKRSIFDTYAFVTEFRDNIKTAMEDYLYSCDVLAEHFGLTPFGGRDDYDLSISWSAAMIEDSGEEFAQYSELQSRGIIGKAELRQWVRGGTIEENRAEVEALAEAEPISGVEYD